MKKFYFIVIGLILFLFTNSAFAQDIYMQAGELTNGAGTSDNKDYKDFTHISSIQFGVSNSDIVGPGGDGKASFREIVITKNVNSSSTKFLLALATGMHIAKVRIVSVGRNQNGNEFVAHEMVFEEVLFTDASSSQIEGCAGGCPGIAESFKFTYAKIKITTYAVGPKGPPVATGVFDWDVAGNKSL